MCTMIDYTGRLDYRKPSKLRVDKVFDLHIVIVA